MAANGSAKPLTPLRAGIYAPLMTFFDPDTEELDLPTLQKHSVMLAKAGLVGLVTMGSNGEAVHLTRAERSSVTRAVREALDGAGFADVPVIVGASEQSIRGTIELCKEAHAAGGEYVLLVPPSYYRYAMDNESIHAYYVAVADASPCPVLIYNFPGAVAGIDMDSDFLIKLAQHPNIVGTKFTCGNTGKLTRVALATDAATAKSSGASNYMAFGGFADFTAQTAASGGSGIIAGGANVLPKLCVRIWDLWGKGQYDEAIRLQKVLSKGDWELTKTAIPGTKSAIESYYGYGGFPRRPLKRLSGEQAKAVKDAIADAIEVEKSL
ncbi:putative dihydrodipicolinate synthetase [Diplodia seriata]|uniref:Putative dihydrodipicolinate synthetase n=1 Tax=Diplodia seriata TaxID=420778 RepID=A0A0G2F0A8_9PEZI|nr:putative dihydrodipicolinate synthetase [Diplodia seriata]